MSRTPLILHERLEQKIDELEKLDVIEKATGPVSWISPVVVVPKQNGIRLCVDMQQTNSAIVWERHPIPTVEEVIHDLKMCFQNLI